MTDSFAGTARRFASGILAPVGIGTRWRRSRAGLNTHQREKRRARDADDLARPEASARELPRVDQRPDLPNADAEDVRRLTGGQNGRECSEVRGGYSARPSIREARSSRTPTRGEWRG